MADVSEISSSELKESTIESICRRPRRMLHRVPPALRAQAKNPWIYDPVVFQLGAYNYLQQKKANDQLNINLQVAEQVKDEVLVITLDSASKEEHELADKGFFIRKFLEHVDEFRHFYGELSKDDCSDEDLAKMMLRDACFVLCLMRIRADMESNNHIVNRLGPLEYSYAMGDILKLDNQIPLSAIKLLFNIIHKETTEADDQWKAFLCKALPGNIMSFGNIELKRVPWGQQQPLHLLEAIRAASLSLNEQQQESSNIGQTEEGNFCPIIYKILKRMGFACRRQKRSDNFVGRLLLSRSVTELKAKGILIWPSGSSSFKDMKFTSYRFFGILELPVIFVTEKLDSRAYLSNLIAFEMSPRETDFAVATYVTFMKSLIQSPKDVRELREKGILFGYGNDEQLMNFFEEINSHGVGDIPYIGHIKERIEDHCNNKWKTWMAELINSKFTTPWSAIALFSAIVLLCLTFLQTIYTIKQSK